MSSQVYQDDQGQVLNSRGNGKHTGEASTVHSTRNYSQFRFSPANRPINQKHLDRLYDAIVAKNMLSQYPITVTPSMIVIDGQHRLKIAEALQVPIYYIVASEMSVDDIRMINDVTLKWTLENYLNYWCEMGNEDYKQIASFYKKYRDISLSFLVQYVSINSRGGSWVDNFRSGKATARRLPEAEQIIIAALDFKPYLGQRCLSKPFLYAVQTVMDTPGYKHETMMTRLEYQSTKLVPCIKTDDYIALLSEIYNYRTRDENKLDFAAHRYHRVREANRRRKQRELAA